MKYSTKIIQKSAKTTPFAGIFFIEDYFDRYKIGELCDEVLGIRAKQAEYSYADIIKSLWMIIPTEKFDATYSYKKCFGYFPGVAFINGLPFNIENRVGNMNVKHNQAEFLELIDVVSRHSTLFYIRAARYNNLMSQLQRIEQWREVELNYEKCEVASIPFTQFSSDMNYRLVIQRTETKDPQGDLFFGKKYVVRTILTNDWDSTEEEIIAYYNQRGAIERQFDIQNNDFNWAHMPFSDMKNNTVFLFLMAMARAFFEFVKIQVHKAFGNLIPLNCRMKKFIFRFVSVAGKWVRRARQNVLILYSDASYSQLLC